MFVVPIAFNYETFKKLVVHIFLYRYSIRYHNMP